MKFVINVSGKGSQEPYEETYFRDLGIDKKNSKEIAKGNWQNDGEKRVIGMGHCPLITTYQLMG